MRLPPRFIRVLSEKRLLCWKIVRIWGWWGWGDYFLTKPPKGTSLADFMHFEPLFMQIRSRVFPPGVTMKKGHYKKKVTVTYLREIPHSTKFN